MKKKNDSSEDERELEDLQFNESSEIDSDDNDKNNKKVDK